MRDDWLLLLLLLLLLVDWPVPPTDNCEQSLFHFSLFHLFRRQQDSMARGHVTCHQRTRWPPLLLLPSVFLFRLYPPCLLHRFHSSRDLVWMRLNSIMIYYRPVQEGYIRFRSVLCTFPPFPWLIQHPIYHVLNTKLNSTYYLIRWYFIWV